MLLKDPIYKLLIFLFKIGVCVFFFFVENKWQIFLNT